MPFCRAPLGQRHSLDQAVSCTFSMVGGGGEPGRKVLEQPGALGSEECTGEADTHLSCQNPHPGNAGRSWGGGGRGGGGPVYVGIVQKDAVCPGDSCGRCWAGAAWSRVGSGIHLSVPCSRCQPWGIRAAGLGKPTSGGYVTVRRLDGN